MIWPWILLIASGSLAASATIFCVVAPLDVRVLAESLNTVAAKAELRWGWGLATWTGSWWPGVSIHRLRVFGWQVSPGPIHRVVTRPITWWRARQEGRVPFDWQSFLRRERIVGELRALQAGAERFDTTETWARLGDDSTALLIDLAASVRLSPRIDLRVGLEDPFALGLVWAAGAFANGVLPQGSFALEPAFDGETVEGYAELKGRLRPLPLAWLGVRFLLLSTSGPRCLRAAWKWWRYPRDVAGVTAHEQAPR